MQAIKRLSGRLTRFLRLQEPSSDRVRQLLIVDDEQAICSSMKEYFTYHGFQVDTASEIEEAVRLIANSSYEVIIQDLRFGINKRATGVEIIKYAQEHSPDTKIIVLTAHATAEIENEARKSGAVAFLRKPQRLSQVAQVVTSLSELPRSPGSHYDAKTAGASEERTKAHEFSELRDRG